MTFGGAPQRQGFDTKTDATTHGFVRWLARCWRRGSRMPDAVIEAQPAHSAKDDLGCACNRATFAEQRRSLMQTWADYLDDLRKGAGVLPSKTA